MPRTKALKSLQQRIMDFLEQHIHENGLPPTRREIAHGCNISSTSVVEYNLRLLDRNGYVKMRDGIARGLDILDDAGQPVNRDKARVQIVGSIAADQRIPAFSIKNHRRTIRNNTTSVPTEISKKHPNLVAVTVEGTSMLDALMNDGDIVVIEPTNNADDGEMVVAWLKAEQQTTLKRFFRDGDQVRLQAANTSVAPVCTTADNVEVKGRVVQVTREL